MRNNVSKYDALKIKSAFLYILNQLGETDMITIFKMIYFANRYHLKLHGRQVIPDAFIAMEQGPVPSFLKDAVDNQRKVDCLDPQNFDILAGCFTVTKNKYTFKPLCESDLDELSLSDIECLNKAIAENKGLSPKELSEKSHDAAWGKVWHTTPNRPMDVLDIARVAGASKKMLAYIKEHEDFDKLLEA